MNGVCGVQEKWERGVRKWRTGETLKRSERRDRRNFKGGVNDRQTETKKWKENATQIREKK